MTSNMKVYVNPEGKYLKTWYVKSHVSDRLVWSWVDLNEATLYPLFHKFEARDWKHNPPHNIVGEFRAEEKRTVTLLGEL